jgi:MFS superfamily sulfate permease-like transporter
MHGKQLQELELLRDLRKTDKGAKVYEIEGPLFFSSANSFFRTI